jgi:hypothetical protein
MLGRRLCPIGTCVRGGLRFGQRAHRPQAALPSYVMRGLVIAPPLTVRPVPGGVVLATRPMTELDPLLRFYAMYWDKIDLSQNGVIWPRAD